MPVTVTVTVDPDRSGNFVCDVTVEAHDVTIQRAIDYVASLGGGSVYFERGASHYILTAAITGTHNNIVFEGNFPVFEASGISYIFDLGGVNLVFRNLVFYGADEADHTCLRLGRTANAENMLVEGCRFYSDGSTQIERAIWFGGTTTTNKGLVVVDCYIHDICWGVYAGRGTVSDVAVVSCSFYNNVGKAIVFNGEGAHNAAGFTAIGNYMELNSGGIHLEDVDYVVILSNIIKDSTLTAPGLVGTPQRGINLDYLCDHVIVSHNLIDTTTQEGLYVAPSVNAAIASYLTFENNHVENCGQEPIWIREGIHIKVTGNVFISNGTKSCDFDVLEDFHIIDNQFFDGSVNVVDCLDGVIANNSIYSALNWGLRTNTTDNIIINGNLIKNCGSGGSAYGVSVLGCDEVIVSDNRCFDDSPADQDWGIRIHDTSSNVLVTDNDLRGNIVGGLWLDGTNVRAFDNLVDGVNDIADGVIIPTVHCQLTQAVNGAALKDSAWASPNGVDVDAATEGAVGTVWLPPEVQQVVRIIIYGWSNVIEATNNMLLNVYIVGGSSSEQWNAESIDVGDVPSEETGGILANDVLHWIIDATDDANIADLIGGDLLHCAAVGEGASAPDIATDAVFGDCIVEYV